MNKALYLLLFAAMLTACKNKPAQPAEHSPAAATTQPSLLKKRLPMLQGVWVKTDYMAKIQQTRSVLASVGLVMGVVGLQVDSAQLKADTLMVEVDWDNQNPGGMVLRDKPGKNPDALQMGDAELGFDVTGGDTSLILYEVYNKQLFKTRYNRILPVNRDRNLSNAVSYAINNALIAGKYQLATGKKAATVTFSNDGMVTGLAGHEKYFIENDLKPGPLKNLDLITFDEFSSRKAVYSYKFEGDKLFLFDTKPDAKGKLMVLGKLKYTLIRIQ